MIMATPPVARTCAPDSGGRRFWPVPQLGNAHTPVASPSGTVTLHHDSGTGEAAAVELASGAAGRRSMDDEVRGSSGLDPAHRRGPRRGPAWGRRRWDGHVNGAAQGHGRPTYAALDLGTNNCRLLVARPTADGFRVIDAFSRIIRLGEGMSTTGRLGEAAVSRALVALAICRDKMQNRGVTRARLIATEACRSAGNGREFLLRVREEVGLELEIVGRDTE